MQSQEQGDRQVFNQIQSIIATKAWYGLSPTGAFNWTESVGNMTEIFRKELGWDRPDLFTIVRDALESAFTPDCLTRVGDTPFIAKVAELMPVYVWTVGDVGWQNYKAKITGLFTHGVDPARFHSTPDNKLGGLRTILQDIHAGQVFVMDDKTENISHVRSLAPELAAQNMELHDFLVKLGTPPASPAAAYRYLRTHAQSNLNPIAILDFDGVIADTDTALKVRGAQNIYNAFTGNH